MGQSFRLDERLGQLETQLVEAVKVRELATLVPETAEAIVASLPMMPPRTPTLPPTMAPTHPPRLPRGSVCITALLISGGGAAAVRANVHLSLGGGPIRSQSPGPIVAGKNFCHASPVAVSITKTLSPGVIS